MRCAWWMMLSMFAMGSCGIHAKRVPVTEEAITRFSDAVVVATIRSKQTHQESSRLDIVIAVDEVLFDRADQLVKGSVENISARAFEDRAAEFEPGSKHVLSIGRCGSQLHLMFGGEYSARIREDQAYTGRWIGFDSWTSVETLRRRLSDFLPKNEEVARQQCDLMFGTAEPRSRFPAVAVSEDACNGMK